MDSPEARWVQNRGRRSSSSCDEDDLSDDGPLLPYQYEKPRRFNADGSRRRSALGAVARVCLFCAAMVVFCILMYIPLYNRAKEQVPRSIVAGWSYHTNRDTKIYVQPNKITTIHNPKTFCHKHQKRKLYLLVVVCSATNNFERRVTIRETWANYTNYIKANDIMKQVKDKYKNYNYTYDLYPDPTMEPNVTNTTESLRIKRDVGFGDLIPKIAEALKEAKNLDKTNNDAEKNDGDDEVRFDDDKILPEFDMNEQFHNDANTDPVDMNYDDDYPSNVMKIPPKGYEEDNNQNLADIISKFKSINDKSTSASNDVDSQVDDENVEFKVVFLLGLPSDNGTDVQTQIDEESVKYGDIIQEDFIDTYNNLTLKSIMMLKWVNNNCNDSLRYILKTDDDMFINMPNLLETVHNKSTQFDSSVQAQLGHKEYLLMGDLICGARPVSDTKDKWYSPRYMYGGRVYPRYLSGTGYVLSLPTAQVLYEAALRTPYFHLEDIYITGMCAARASPAVRAHDAAGFQYAPSVTSAPGGHGVGNTSGGERCAPLLRATLHGGVTSARQAVLDMNDRVYLDRCQRMYLTKVRHDMIRAKLQRKRTKKLPHAALYG